MKRLATPQPAASTILLREANGTIEVLLQQRHPGMVFGGHWVFPGGTVDAADLSGELAEPGHDQANSLLRCALRELHEEAGIHHDVLLPLRQYAAHRNDLLHEKLIYLNRWVTPVHQPKRFDTRFYIVAIDAETPIRDDPREIAQSCWLSVMDAMQEGLRGQKPMIFPTLKNLQWLARYRNLAELVSGMAGRGIGLRIEPTIGADATGRAGPVISREIEARFL